MSHNRLNLSDGDLVTVDGTPCRAGVFGKHGEYIHYWELDKDGKPTKAAVVPDLFGQSDIRRLPAPHFNKVVR